MRWRMLNMAFGTQGQVHMLTRSVCCSEEYIVSDLAGIRTDPRVYAYPFYKDQIENERITL